MHEQCIARHDGRWAAIFLFYLTDKIVEELGEGTFGKVVKCVDRDAKRGDDKHMAVKIVKNVQRYRDAAEIEIDILKAIQKGDPEGEQYVRYGKLCFDIRGRCRLVALFVAVIIVTCN